MRNGAPFQETGQPGVHPSSRVARAAFFSFAALALAASLLCAGPPPARALTDLDYDYLLNRSKDFAQAEELLRDSWARLKDRSSPERFATLVSAQRQWLSKERDQEAKKYFDQGQPLEEAYARVSRERAAWLDAIESSKEKAAFQEDSGRAAAISCLSGDCRNGQGVAEYADGSRYEGKFVDGRRSGHGTLDLKNGTRYTGGFSDDAMTGIFKIDYPNGNSYVGDLKNGKLDGHGIYAWADGKQYGGAFHDNAASGQGTMIYPDGSQYEGEFRQWGINGEGTKTDASGHAVHGVWEGGVLVQETPAPVAKAEPETASGNQTAPAPTEKTPPTGQAAPTAQSAPDERVASVAPSDANPKWGYIDKTGKVVIEPRFTDVSLFSGGVARVKTDKGYGLIDKTGRMVVKPEYQALEIGDDVFIPAQNNYRWGVLRTDGSTIVEPIYKEPVVYSEGLAWVPDPDSTEQLSLYRILDANGRPITTVRLHYPQPFHDGLAAFRDVKGWGYVDGTGKIVIEPRFAKAEAFHEGLAEVSLSRGKKGYVDKTGAMVIEPIYDATSPFENGVAQVRSGDETMLIDKNGKRLTDRAFSRIDAFKNGLATFRDSGGLYGVIDAKGRTIIEPKFAVMSDFIGGLAGVEFGDGGYGFVDASGKTILSLDGKLPGAFHDHIASVMENGEWGFIDENGNWLVKPVYKAPPYYSEGLWVVEVNGRWGFLDAKAKMIINPIYTRAGWFTEGLAPVEMNVEPGSKGRCGPASGTFAVGDTASFQTPCLSGMKDDAITIQGVVEIVCGAHLLVRARLNGNCWNMKEGNAPERVIWKNADDCALAVKGGSPNAAP